MMRTKNPGNHFLYLYKQTNMKTTIDWSAVYEECRNKFEKYKHENTISTSEVPWTVVNTIGIYTIAVRKAQFFNQRPVWGFSVYTGGSMYNNHNYTSPQDAYFDAVDYVEAQEKEFKDKYGF